MVRPVRSQRYRCSWAAPVALSLLSAADLVYLFESEAVRSQPRESESIEPAVLVPFSEVGREQSSRLLPRESDCTAPLRRSISSECSHNWQGDRLLSPAVCRGYRCHAEMHARFALPIHATR